MLLVDGISHLSALLSSMLATFPFATHGMSVQENAFFRTFLGSTFFSSGLINLAIGIFVLMKTDFIVKKIDSLRRLRFRPLM